MWRRIIIVSMKVDHIMTDHNSQHEGGKEGTSKRMVRIAVCDELSGQVSTPLAIHSTLPLHPDPLHLRQLPSTPHHPPLAPPKQPSSVWCPKLWGGNRPPDAGREPTRCWGGVTTP